MRRARAACYIRVLPAGIRHGIAREQRECGERLVATTLRSLISIVFLSVLISGTSFACSLPPAYFEEEELVHTIGVRDLVKDSQAIVTGHFSQDASEDDLTFSIIDTLKPHDRFGLETNINVTFLDVKNYFFETGEEKIPNSSAKLLKWQLEHGGNNLGGWGGPIASIHHGADCERMVFLFTDQSYLLFLDNTDDVKALFPINEEIKKLLPLIKDKAFSHASLPYRK